MAGKLVEFTDDNFATEVLASALPVVVDMWAPWCGPCKMLGPIIEGLSEHFGERVKIGKFNVDDNPKMAQELNVQSIPTILFFKGGKVVEKQVGLLAKEPLRVKIENFLAG